MRFAKKGVRMLGIAESFRKGGPRSILVGVVQRADLVLDGFAVAFPTVGGLDATDKVIELYRSLGRQDIDVIAISGVVISWYNVIDLERVHRETGRPLISITYEESEGLLEHFKRNFPDDWRVRWEIHERNGERVKVRLKTGYHVFVRQFGMSLEEAVYVLNKFTLEGKKPEPIRVAQLIASRLAKAIL
ncbi:hypothetical protein B6U99_02520 [Candidatus Geothermarchaeota archaeon ex4572_27]|nr:MAG: hypothetical protein B6U99_02520 [Candidatus Geothermarchaeota archaeon ex4572_27]